MSLSQVRRYFNQSITNQYSNYVEWTDAFNIENIPRTLLNNRYHIGIGPISSTAKQDTHIVDSQSVTLTIWKSGFLNVSDARDEILNIAHAIRLKLINPVNIETFRASVNGEIQDVQSVSITPEVIDATNDNVIQVSIQFNVLMYFCAT